MNQLNQLPNPSPALDGGAALLFNTHSLTLAACVARGAAAAGAPAETAEEAAAAFLLWAAERGQVAFYARAAYKFGARGWRRHAAARRMQGAAQMEKIELDTIAAPAAATVNPQGLGNAVAKLPTLPLRVFATAVCGGYNVTDAARLAGVSPATGYRMLGKVRDMLQRRGI